MGEEAWRFGGGGEKLRCLGREAETFGGGGLYETFGGKLSPPPP